MKLAKRCTVDQHFLSVMYDIQKRIYDRELGALQKATYNKDYLTAKRGPVLARLHPIVHGVNSDDRVGMEYEKTRLHVLPYTQFTAFRHFGTSYLAGVTQPIAINFSGKTYHLGPYKVCVPVSIFDGTRLHGVHFIPLKFPQSTNRHPHHRVSLNGEEENTHPLDRHVSTCWGSYASILIGLVEDGDIPELFRQFYIYLKRYNHHSPLIYRGINGLDFDTHTPWSEATEVA